MTVDEFRRLPRRHPRAELVGGELIAPPLEASAPPSQTELNTEAAFWGFVAPRSAGHFLTGGVPVVTAPDTVRVADMAFWCKEKIPQAPRGADRFGLPPDLVLEVREAAEPWLRRLERVVEYLRAAVPVVIILDPVTASASVFRPADRPQVVEVGSTLTLPDVLPGFEVPVIRFFEE